MSDCKDSFCSRLAWQGALLFVLLVLWFASPNSSAAQNHNVIGGDTSVVWRPVTSSQLIPADYFGDHSKLTDQILNLDKTSKEFTNELPSFGFSRDVLVSELAVQASSSATGSDYVIYINYPLLDDIKLFRLSAEDNLKQVYHAGDRFDFESRPMRNRAFAFPVMLEPGQNKVFYLVAKSRDTLELPINLFTRDEFEKNAQNEQYILGSYFGGVFVMAFFMLSLYVNYKDRTLILMSIYLFCLAGVVGSVTGIASQVVFPESPEVAKNIRIVWLAVSMMCTLQFGIDYLESKTNMPKLHRGMVVAIGGTATLPFLIFVLPFYYLIQLTLFFCFIVAAIAISASIIMLRKRYVPAIYYSVAWGCFLFGGISNVGRAFGVLPVNFWTVYGFQIGSILSVVCLGLGIAAKFGMERENRLKLEKVAFKEKQNRLKAQIIAQEEQFKSKNAEAESKAKGEFLANMSHEIRTPMNGVLGLTQLLKDTSLDDAQLKLLNTIEASGKTLLGVLNDILDYSKIESGKFDIEEIPVRPKSVVKTTTELFRQRAEEKGIDIYGEVGADVPELVASDPTRLSQILLNLTSNALKFTNQGEIRIRVTCEDEKYLRFEVSDTGIGLSTDQQNRLFQSFSQADSSTTRKYGGTGLGLYISRRLSELMGGSIGVYSAPGKGSTFWFTVGLNELGKSDLDDVDNSNVSANDNINTLDFSMINLVVAEDNKVNQMVIKGMLKKLGIDPTIVENGAECVSAISESDSGFNCVLMDCEMPEMDGYEATERIRETDLIQQPFIIGLSANALKEQETKALEVGMNEYLRKPVELEQLVAKLLVARERVSNAA